MTKKSLGTFVLDSTYYAIFYKPCFVPVVLGATTFDNHLSTAFRSQERPFVSSFPMPRPKFGLLAWGVYRVPLSTFPWKLRHCGTFRSSLTYLERRSHFDRRNVWDVPRLMDSPSTNTTSITAGASMDFPHGSSCWTMRLSKNCTLILNLGQSVCQILLSPVDSSDARCQN